MNPMEPYLLTDSVLERDARESDWNNLDEGGPHNY